MKTLAQTGNGWMTFKDASNEKANQVGLNKENVIHLSNLCTEIISNIEQRNCSFNLGSGNLSKYVDGDDIDYEKLGKNVEIAVKYLDRVVDINFYPIDTALDSNHRWRPVGLGLMGLQDALFKLNTAFDSEKGMQVSKKVQEEIYYHALKASMELSKTDHTAHLMRQELQR